MAKNVLRWKRVINGTDVYTKIWDAGRMISESGGFASFIIENTNDTLDVYDCKLRAITTRGDGSTLGTLGAAGLNPDSPAVETGQGDQICYGRWIQAQCSGLRYGTLHEIHKTTSGLTSDYILYRPPDTYTSSTIVRFSVQTTEALCNFVESSTYVTYALDNPNPILYDNSTGNGHPIGKIISLKITDGGANTGTYSGANLSAICYDSTVVIASPSSGTFTGTVVLDYLWMNTLTVGADYSITDQTGTIYATTNTDNYGSGVGVIDNLFVEFNYTWPASGILNPSGTPGIESYKSIGDRYVPGIPASNDSSYIYVGGQIPVNSIIDPNPYGVYPLAESSGSSIVGSIINAGGKAQVDLYLTYSGTTRKPGNDKANISLYHEIFE